ncbi:peptidoglycan-recognition protein 2-like isoform X2 [Rhynchophorus ferrugineus]|uniref:peptidoglycan-recognition protein 2-like isoform X2 n=1 Tax=Rhynchophorus ferrugineus TaxID=354439 RepID=UPI003FCC7A67
MRKYFVAVLFCVLQIGLKTAELPSVCPEIVSKRSWNASRPVGIDYLILPVKNIVIHHTDSKECLTKEDCATLLQSIQNLHIGHMDFHDIGYNFLIGGDGRVYEGAGWHKVGAHTKGYNSRSLGIAFIGDYSSKLPSTNMIEAGKSLLKCGLEIGEIHLNYVASGARKVGATGNRPSGELKTWPNCSYLLCYLAYILMGH